MDEQSLPLTKVSQRASAATNSGGPVVPSHRDGLGTFLGLIVLFAGIGLLGLTFKLAYGMFSIPASSTLGVVPGKQLDVAKASDSAASLLLRIVLLIVMAFVGSTIANRGISMYAAARGHHK